ncbi:MAG: sulfotransferase family protein, partial [Ktedonobacteraceae bacterium]
MNIVEMMEMKNNKLIVVLGMHRSGTSAITRGLQVMGVELGDHLMPPIEGDNDKGFWEDVDINALNIEILRAINSDWCYLAAIDLGDLEILRKQGYFLRAAELLRQKASIAPIYGFKDPRMAKLLPFWKEVFTHCQLDVVYVIALRNPRSVVRSLAKRNDIEEAQGYLLWLGHVIISLTGSANSKRVLVDYDRLMQAPDRELIRVAKCAGLEIDSTDLQSYKNEYLDQSLRHTVYDLNDLLLDDNCLPIVHEVYSALLDVAAEKTKFDDLELQDKVASWSDEFDRLKSPLRLVDKILQKTVAAKKAVNERDTMLAAKDAAWMARLDKTACDFESEIARIVAERDTMLGEKDAAWMERLDKTACEFESEIALIAA